MIKCSFNILVFFPRQDRESAERAHEEKVAAATLSARERERALSALLEQTEARHQQRGQCLHLHCLLLTPHAVYLTRFNRRSILEDISSTKTHLSFPFLVLLCMVKPLFRLHHSSITSLSQFKCSLVFMQLVAVAHYTASNAEAQTQISITLCFRAEGLQ